MINNRDIRLQILKKRWELKPSYKTHLDHQIYIKVLQNISAKSLSKYIAFYWPMENEVDTIAIIHELLQSHYKICLPYLNKNKMFFKPITTIHFEYEYWKNMRQPSTSTIVNGDQITLMIIPLIGFNKTKHRLGYGFNHYNNYLNTHTNIRTIGLAYDFQRNDEFVINRYDKVLDLIITN
ncbi:MAG: 5-formyltetrahydrofolate cyclo-ligase [Mycoplasmataceae bacterium]|nr:5-formyltetrahydrofolate cyclo-ligase [Mycoplasmataceae bacterium]